MENEGNAKRRLMITHMVLENFKSYAGVQTVGPFHKVHHNSVSTCIHFFFPEPPISDNVFLIFSLFLLLLVQMVVGRVTLLMLCYSSLESEPNK